MSNKNIINKVIKDNFKIGENQTVQNAEVNKIKEIDNNTNNYGDIDNSFKQLLSLQLSIKKHSGLKELCKFNL